MSKGFIGYAVIDEDVLRFGDGTKPPITIYHRREEAKMAAVNLERVVKVEVTRVKNKKHKLK